MADLAYETRAVRPTRWSATTADGATTAYTPTQLMLERAQALCDAGRAAEAAALLGEVGAIAPDQPRLTFRSQLVHGGLAQLDGRLDEALAAFRHARELAEQPGFGDRDRAEALMRLGGCQYKRASIGQAVALLTLSLELCDRTLAPSDWIRAYALIWRGRCYQRQRDWEAARADIERALELATALQDDQAVAHAYFQASLLAERQGQWLLARYYAEEAQGLYTLVRDGLNLARLTNNLGGLDFLLGRTDEAERNLQTAHALALEAGSEADAAQAMSSLAQVHMRTGRHEEAELEARVAVDLLVGRRDFLDELGNVQLVLGRALLEQGQLEEASQWFDAAELSFTELDSVSHRAAAWVAQGDLAQRAGDTAAAAALYRRAAESLQDFHF